jgi:uncharacterized membrane protein YkvA (DUF1232 family)
MSMDISITLSDADLEHFVSNIRSAEKKAETLDAASIIGAARKMLEDSAGRELPDFVSTRLNRLDTTISMVEDAGFGLPDEDREHALAALTYFANPDDLIPDNVPVLGFLDDAIMIELCVRELKHEIEAYEDFRDWRDNEARQRGENPAQLMLTRVEWAEARRAEAIERRRRRRRDSYTSGAWKPVLFRVR